ncbi:MAG: hypothetical protein HGA49_13200 [Eubacteriaceae bacterium]|nr:hypothetical protein [Eubacteriaceae bacterium]
MKNILHLINVWSDSGIEKSLSVKEISEMMRPVGNENIKLPRSFAHHLRVILDTENEKKLAKDKCIKECDHID